MEPSRKLVDPFDEPASSSSSSPLPGVAGSPPRNTQAPRKSQLIDPFDEPAQDYSNPGEFGARNATEGQKWRLAAGFLTAPTTNQRADIIRKVLPDAQISQDGQGNLIVSHQGEQGYINKPGFSARDAFDVVSSIAKYFPAARATTWGTGVLSKLGIGAAATGATSIAEDVAAIPQGSQQGIDPLRAGATAGGSVVGQMVAPPIAQGAGWLTQKGVQAWQALRGTQGAVTPQGTLSAAGTRLAQQMGFDPRQLTGQLVAQLESASQTAAKAGQPAAGPAAANLALANRFRVPLTRGELTEDFAQQSLEENLRKMDVTTRAGQIMRGQTDDSARALRGSDGTSGFGLLTREINPSPVADVAEAGQSVMQGVRQSANQARGAYQGAYRSARESGAALNSKSYREFLGNAEGTLKDAVDYDPQLMPKTAAMLSNLRQRATWMTEMGAKAPNEIPLAKLENLRRLMNAAWKSADATDRMGLDILRSQFDEMVNGALDAGRVTGDPTAVEAWKLGRQLFARYSDLYGPGGAAGAAERTAGKTVRNWLVSESATGEDAIRGVVLNPALARRVIQIQGEDSPAHAALKQGVLEYVFRPALKGDGISPQVVKSRFEQFFKGQYRENMAAIFSPKDRAAIGEFYRLSLAKIPQPGVVNYSNTASSFMRALQQLGQRLGVAAGMSGNLPAAAALSGAGALGRARAAGQAREAARGLVPRTRGQEFGTMAGAAVGESAQR